MEVATGLWRLELAMPGSFMRSVNVYLVRDRDGYVLVDCGLEGEASWSDLNRLMAEVGASADAVHTVLATHGHPDHLGLGERLQRHSGAQVWLHRDDVEFIRHRHVEWQRFRELLVAWLERYGFPAAEARELVKVIENSRAITTAPRIDRLLEGGEELAVGAYRFEVMWTPGHTPGHVCLYEPSRRLLLCGDHILAAVAPNVSMQPYADHNPMAGYLGSLRALQELPIDLTLPGHGPPFRTIAARAHQLLGQQLERRDQLLRLLDSHPRTAYELAAVVWQDTTPLNWSQFRGHLRRNAVGTLVAHLELLAAEGKVERREAEVVRFALAR